VLGLRLDAKKAPTDNEEVRLAIAHAIDLPTIIETIAGGLGTPVPVWQSPFSFGYDDSLQPYNYDPEEAKQHITASGLATPIKITYDILSGDSQVKEIADAVKGMLDEVGFDTEIRIQESATYFDDYRFGKLGNVVWFGWGGWTLDYDNTYFSMHKTGESYNPSYSNPEVDKLLEEERTTLDQNRRLEIAKQINRILYDEAPDVALYQITDLWGVNNRVKNFLIPPDQRLWLAGVWVEE
jgi:peptide/nickel transport system substrate-binding protein